MGRSHIHVLRAGLVLVVLAGAAYLTAIWTTELTSARFGLTGVVFMVPGLLTLLVGFLMSPVPRSKR